MEIQVLILAQNTNQPIDLASLIPFSTTTHRDEATLGISAATVNLEHTVLIMHHIARLTEAALLAGRWDFGTGILTVAIQISTGRLTCGKAVCVVAVGGTLKSYGVEGD